MEKSMFLKNVIDSKRVGLCIVLIPVMVFMFYWLVLDPEDWLMPGGGSENSETSDGSVSNEVENEWVDVLGLKYVKVLKYHTGAKIFGIGMIISFVLNLIMLLIVPCLGSANEKEKRQEFLAGFGFNLILVLVLPALCMRFTSYPDFATFGKLLALGAVGFFGPFLVGSRFVTESYKNAFWFYTKELQ
ncbi:MAG: hypothetical protein LBH18_04790 [Spirochaetaceae bacterium]|jgi:hypothetical protein|nr:hypothetical protein [Spirochaetaceae bacterium]